MHKEKKARVFIHVAMLAYRRVKKFACDKWVRTCKHHETNNVSAFLNIYAGIKDRFTEIPRWESHRTNARARESPSPPIPLSLASSRLLLEHKPNQDQNQHQRVRGKPSAACRRRTCVDCWRIRPRTPPVVLARRGSQSSRSDEAAASLDGPRPRAPTARRLVPSGS